MPIDFDTLAAAFRPRFDAELKTVTAAFALLQRWLSGQVEKARGAERATRGLPAIRFQGGSVAVWVDRAQHGLLTPGELPASFTGTLGSAIERFLGGIGLAGRAWREAHILPNFTGLVRRAADLVERAVSGALPVQPGIFALDRTHTASGLFGGAALAIYGLHEGAEGFTGRDQLERALGDFRRSSAVARALPWGSLADPLRSASVELAGALTPPGEREQGAASWQIDPATRDATLTLPELLTQAAQWIAGLLLVLPMLPALLAPMLDAAVLRAKLTVLEAFEAIEARVFDIRRSVIDIFFVDLPAFGLRAYEFVLAAGQIATELVSFYARFAEAYTRALAARLVVYLEDVKGLVSRLDDLARLIGDVVDAAMRFNLREALFRSLDLPTWTQRSLPDSLGEWIEVLTGGGADDLRDWLHTKLTAVWIFTWGDNELKRRAARQVVDLFVVDVGHVPMSSALAPYAGPAFPNVHATLVRGQALSLGTAARVAGERARGILHTGAGAFDALAIELDRNAAESARLGDPARYRGIAGWADELSSSLYGDQATSLRAGALRLGPLSRAYEDALARGGFYVVGEAIPRFVDALADLWSERRRRWAEGNFAPPSGLPAGAAPTSPHIVDRRVRLGRVRLSRLVIRAGVHPLDDELGAAVAARFKTEVERAYATGLSRVPA